MTTIRPQAPCYNCPDRHEVCWSSCEKYQTFKAAKERDNKKRYEEYKADCIYYDGIRKVMKVGERTRKWK